jgi:hypothetical protein
MSGVIAPPFMTSVLDGGEWSASRPGPFTHGERAPDTQWIGSWVGPRTGQDAEYSRIQSGGYEVLVYVKYILLAEQRQPHVEVSTE